MAHGHDVHFLERLERLSTPETELALSLYQDPLLTRALLEQLRLPEGAARVALSLGDSERGPFVVVARDGHFVTCLAEGMSPGDHPVIPRGQLDAIARRARHGRDRSRRRRRPGRGALRNLGHELGRNTIKRILLEHGVDPAPKRGKTMPWKTFLKSHFSVIAATDFFTVEVLTLGGLVRYVVWFVIDLESRRVHIAGLIRHPHGAWIQQVARNLTDSVDGFLRSKRYLIDDRDPLFTDAFRTVLRAAGIECLKLPARSPT